MVLSVAFYLLLVSLASQAMGSLGTTNILLTETNHISIQGHIDNHLVNYFFTQAPHVDPSAYVYINSPGGSVVAGNRIVRYILHKNYTCIADKAMSMAFVILQACKHRHVMHGSILMQHQQYLEIDGNLENIKGYLEMVTAMEHEMTTMQASRLNMSISEFKTRTNTDWWLYGDDILKHKAADKIVDSVECDPKLVEKKYVRKKNTGLFGFTVNITYSGCPLIESEVDM